MFKKIRLIIANIRYCFVRSLEFRNEVMMWTVASAIWAILAVFSISVIFGQVESIAGWTKNEVILLTVTHEMFISLMWITTIPSMVNLSSVIRNGGFDFYLLKPVSSRFLASFSRFEFDQPLRVTILILLLLYFLNNFGINMSLIYLVGYFVLLFIGVGIFYSVFFMLAALTFWFTRLFNLEDFYDSVMSAGRFPTFAYGGLLRFFYFYIVPAVFSATYPTQFLLGKGSWELIIQGFVTVVVFYIVSNLFWNFALKRYSSASS